ELNCISRTYDSTGNAENDRPMLLKRVSFAVPNSGVAGFASIVASKKRRARILTPATSDRLLLGVLFRSLFAARASIATYQNLRGLPALHPGVRTTMSVEIPPDNN